MSNKFTVVKHNFGDEPEVIKTINVIEPVDAIIAAENWIGTLTEEEYHKLKECYVENTETGKKTRVLVHKEDTWCGIK